VIKLPPDLVSRPAANAAAVIGLAHLDEARASAARLDDPEDAEALHDFRVGVRRLRTLLRTFRPELGDVVPSKLQRRLRDLTRATTAARDAEVQLSWVRAQRREVGRRPGLPWFVARLADRRDRAYADVGDHVVPAFRLLERRVRRALNHAAPPAGPTGPLFATAAARGIRDQATSLEQELAAARAPRDADAIHAARIAAKRLRYLLESLAGDGAPGAPAAPAAVLVNRLKALQDLLGDLHDLQVLSEELGDAVADAAAERARRLHALALDARLHTRGHPRRPAPASAGPLALARLAAREQERLFLQLERDWRAGGLAALLRDVTTLADALAAAPPPPPAPSPAPLGPPARPLRIRYAHRTHP
jgi:CHAD domain-containing protein